MKHFLLLVTMCLTCILATAQTFNGNGDGTSWFDPDNWDTDMIPSTTGNAIIPSGFSVNQNGLQITVNSLTLQGTAILNGNTNIITTGTSTLEPDSIANLSSNSFSGSGTVNAQGTINISTTTAFSGAITINNTGMILINGGALQINVGTLNNLAPGTIEIQTDGSNITASNFGILNNEGLIKKTTTNGSANLQCSLNNNNGIIQVENGTIVIGSTPGGSLTNGTYNVFPQAVLDLALSFTVSGTLQGNIDGTLNLGTSGLSSVFTIAPNMETIFDFSGSGAINFVNPTFQGGGIITNKNVINLISLQHKRLVENTTFNNENTINITSGGNLVINDGTFNNLSGSIIDMQADMGNISWTNGSTHALNNNGLIKKTTSNGEARIQIDLNNNDGEISVENGILTFLGANGKNLIDGTYNVDSNAVFNWTSDVNLTGNISGIIDGDLNWNNDVIVNTSASLNFSGLGNFNWTNNDLTGGGFLTNNSVLNLINNNNKRILGGTQFENLNTVIMTSGHLGIDNGFFFNFGGALLDLQGNNSNITGTQITTRPLVNSGIIRQSNANGLTRITTPTNNSGEIQLLNGELEFFGTDVLENGESGYITGIGTLNVPELPDYTNDGIISPGLSPGILTIEGNYKSSSSSYLVIELNGLTQGTDYDLLQIQGNAAEGSAIFEGSVNVILGFEPSVNDEFVIATTSGTITTCNLTSPTTASFNGNTYTFDVICRNNNEVVLTVVDPLSINEFEVILVTVFPNPTKDLLHIKDKHNAIQEIELISISGQVVLKQEFKYKPISLSQLPKGVYFIRLYNKNSFITKKIIKT